MDKTDKIRQDLKELLLSQNLAVLSTHQDGQPYASLVAFVAAEDLKHLFFVTPKTTRKFSNLSADCRVAMLINSSQNQAADFHQALSVTVIGSAEEISGDEKKRYLQFYLARHPYLQDFAKSPTCALVRVTAQSYYLVKNFQNVMELHISE
ncbi:MAG: pyridoxamine 5'-phosphate oxidase family protein [Desulfobacterales bacterium]|jgi:nitroimidazol reductase NimA-like FMN-containing flavoprotein (pyridoxamine 5'-phosphate oxidase superfamily)